ncbi:MAG: CCA tRNA nucleotidyltransferase [Acidobacteria bacterium]|nr:CCA tRNA nucleotidyltransferase [Acidobacteriota bacterium]
MIAKSVIELCRAVKEIGGRALLVGGWVRDFARGVESVDYDIEVYGVEAAALRALLDQRGRVDAVGEAFTVYKVRLREGRKRFVVDVSLPRHESKIGRGHRGFVVTGDPHMSFAEAARRRDFTINSMMYDPLADEYIDIYGGREDLQRGIIRVADPATFIEDSLRVLRAMQFAARFEFTIDPATVELCRSIDLSDLPAERIWAEMEKWLFAARPSLGLHAARELGITENLWPELHALSGCPQDPAVHPEGDVFIHTGMVLDEARKLIDDLSRPKQLAVMLGALCHDLGKPATTKVESVSSPTKTHEENTKEGREGAELLRAASRDFVEKKKITAKGHEAVSIQLTEQFLDRLKVFTFDNYDVRRQTLALVEHHAVPYRWGRANNAGQTITDGQFRRLALQVEPELLYRVARADCLGRAGDFAPNHEEWFFNRVRELGIEKHAPEPLLLGRHVLAMGLSPGKHIGEITRAVYEQQLDGEVRTLEDAIAAARQIVERVTPPVPDSGGH